MTGACPNCGAPLSGMMSQHCPACGQRLTWAQASTAAWTVPQPPPQAPPPTYTAPKVKPDIGSLAAAARSLGAFSLIIPPLSVIAIPVGFVSLSAIAQGKTPREGLWPTVGGIFLGAWGFLGLAMTVKIFSVLASLGAG